MRRAPFSTVALVFAGACGGHGYEARTTTLTGAPMITTGPGAGEAELSRSLRASSERLALEVCKHEDHCGRESVSSCIDATLPRARDELRS